MDRYRSSTVRLSLQILVTVEIVSMLLGLICWKGDLSLYLTTCRVVVVTEF